jgi:dGTPase
VREYFEELESQHLAAYAAKSVDSKGRHYDEPKANNRTCFQRDRDRIVHSKAFRRLKHKTQVFISTESDHYRSRMTHSLEVAQISRHLARLLRLNEDLSEAIALAHDLGHTPFGHSGEHALNRLMTEHGGFEHNLQSRRIVDFLETKYPHFPGLNLSFEIREGLIKHETPWDHPESSVKSFNSMEAQVCNLGDEIAYNNHDLDDGMTSGLINDDQITSEVTLWKEAKKKILSEYQNLSDKDIKYLINSLLISSQVNDVYHTTTKTIQDLNITQIEDLATITKPVVRFSPEMKEKNLELRKFLFTKLYQEHHIYRMNKKGQLVINRLFKAFVDDKSLLPEIYQARISEDYPKERLVCDYVAGMTDTYAQSEFETLFA